MSIELYKEWLLSVVVKKPVDKKSNELMIHAFINCITETPEHYKKNDENHDEKFKTNQT